MLGHLFASALLVFAMVNVRSDVENSTNRRGETVALSAHERSRPRCCQLMKPCCNRNETRPCCVR